MNFTDNPFERMMKQKPRPMRPAPPKKPPPGSPCYGCSYWRGIPCLGICYRELTLSRTSGQLGAKLEGGQSHG
nr:hypothetical protein [Oscillibacter sp.]